MPKIGKKKVFIESELNGNRYIEVDMFVNANGLFYVPLPLYMEPAIKGYSKNYFNKNKKETKINVFNKNMKTLISSIGVIYRLHEEPDVTEEIIIMYNIESHVSFATDEYGTIYRNAEKSGTRWATSLDKNDMYGGHHSSNVSDGGFSLTIGARALKKITMKYGSKKKIKYERYEDTRAAKLLNKWCSFSLPDNAKEMPYTDQAALFFDNLMFGMANVSKMIQERTNSKENLLNLITSGANLLGSPKKELS